MMRASRRSVAVVSAVAVIAAACGLGGDGVSWRRDVGAVERGRALVVGDVAVVATEDDEVVGLERDSGDTRWRWSAPGRLLDRSLAVAGGHVIVHVPTDAPSWLCAVDAEDGVEQWCVSADRGDALTGEVQMAGDATQVVVTAMDGVARSFDAADGSLRWERELEPADLQDDPVFPGAVAVADGMVVVGSGAKENDDDIRGAVAGLDPATGEVRWQTPVPIGVILRHELVAAGDDVVVQVAETVSLLDAVTGTLRWEVALPPPQAGAYTEAVARPAVVGDLVVVLPIVTWAFPQESVVLNALDRADGTVRWSLTEPPVPAPPVPFHRDALLAGLGEVSGAPAMLGEDLTVFDPEDGTVRATVELGLTWGQPFAGDDGQVVAVDSDGAVVAATPGD